MKKTVSILLACILLLTSTAGFAAAKEPKYSLSTKKGHALQNEPDRLIAEQEPEMQREMIPGESPTTGLAWEGDYLPMLVQIGNAIATFKSNGRTYKMAGIGKAAPWGIQYADVLYESLIYRLGTTRYSALFNDSFSQGQPQAGVGPVRSSRISPLLLHAQWRGGFVSAGGYTITDNAAFLALWGQLDPSKRGILFDHRSQKYSEYFSRIPGVKSPDNLNADIVGMRELFTDTQASTTYPFTFTDEVVYGSDYAQAGQVHLDWGNAEYISHFTYSSETGDYTRMTGPTLKPVKWLPHASYLSMDDRSEEDMQPLTFANLIVQRVDVTYPNNQQLNPVPESIGKGNADIFIGGRYIPGYWVRQSLSDPTFYFDDQGNELKLNRGKTYIALLPPESLCLFMAE